MRSKCLKINQLKFRKIEDFLRDTVLKYLNCPVQRARHKFFTLPVFVPFSGYNKDKYHVRVLVNCVCGF